MRNSWISLGLLVAALLAFVGTAIGTRLSLSDLLTRDAQRGEALLLETELQRLMTRLVELDSGQRAFILTGLPPFLLAYEEARDEIGRQRARLRQRMSDSGVPAPMLDQLDRLIDVRIAHSRLGIERRREDKAMPVDLAGYVDGKQLMDELRLQVDALSREQQRRIEATDAQAQRVQRRTTWLTQSLLAAGLLTLMLALALMVRERRLRDGAEAAMRDANAELERKVAQRTQALSRALSRIRSFASELDSGIEAERRRLAREVHDQIGQLGTAIQMIVAALRPELPQRAAGLLHELEGAAQEAIRSARQITASLRPPLLDELGLAAALDHYLQTLSRQSGVCTQLELHEADLLTAAQATPLFRIVQEACTNVLRHANATTLRVAGRPAQEDGREGYELEVIDDGRGPGEARPDSSGLRGMRERATLAGGTFSFGAALWPGARVRVWLPLASPGRQRAAPRDVQVQEGRG
jgi:signal transduction histidine kinase